MHTDTDVQEADVTEIDETVVADVTPDADDDDVDEDEEDEDEESDPDPD